MSSKAILELLQQCQKAEMQFIDGKADWIKQPFEGVMQEHELLDFLEKIKSEKWRGRLHVETRDRKYFHVRFERSLK